MSDANRNRPAPASACPPPSPKHSAIVLGHGGGGRLTADLVREVFMPALSNPILDRLNDSA